MLVIVDSGVYFKRKIIVENKILGCPTCKLNDVFVVKERVASYVGVTSSNSRPVRRGLAALEVVAIQPSEYLI